MEQKVEPKKVDPKTLQVTEPSEGARKRRKVQEKKTASQTAADQKQ